MEALPAAFAVVPALGVVLVRKGGQPVVEPFDAAVAKAGAYELVVGMKRGGDL